MAAIYHITATAFTYLLARTPQYASEYTQQNAERTRRVRKRYNAHLCIACGQLSKNVVDMHKQYRDILDSLLNKTNSELKISEEKEYEVL